MQEPLPERRPLKTRNAGWAIALAAWLARRGLAPNAISVLSVVFAAGACACFALSASAGTVPRSALLVGAAACVQLRLICNLLDGMVAIEGGLGTATGALYNEAPDRLADALILVGAGWAARPLPSAVDLGWACAVLAVMTAYIRALGQALGGPGSFIGPMAKPQRMATITVAAVVAAGAAAWGRSAEVLWGALVVVALGTALTCVRRLGAIARHLQQR